MKHVKDKSNGNKKKGKMNVTNHLKNKLKYPTSKSQIKCIAKAKPARSNKLAKLRKLLEQDTKNDTVSVNMMNNDKGCTLRERMLNRLKAARFRYINEKLYKIEGKEAAKVFRDDPAAYKAYHDGYEQQVASWPINPVDIIIQYIKKRPKTNVIADLGCGNAKIAQSLENKVHSFDLVAKTENVVECDMAKVPLKSGTIDIAVFCLSLMGTNLRDYLFEANRILQIRGILIIAEIESRIESLETFIANVERFGLSNTHKDLSHKLFCFLHFKKVRDLKHKNKMPIVTLKPCLYKKR